MIGSPGRSAAWLARLLWEQEAGGSNPPAPTNPRDPGPSGGGHSGGLPQVRLQKASLGARAPRGCRSPSWPSALVRSDPPQDLVQTGHCRQAQGNHTHKEDDQLGRSEDPVPGRRSRNSRGHELYEAQPERSANRKTYEQPPADQLLTLSLALGKAGLKGCRRAMVCAVKSLFHHSPFG